MDRYSIISFYFFFKATFSQVYVFHHTHDDCRTKIILKPALISSVVLLPLREKEWNTGSTTNGSPFQPQCSLAGIESHGGIGAEFSKYLEEARIYIKDCYSDIDTLQGEGSAFRRCIDIISIYTCKANTILFDNIRHGYYRRTTPRETGHFDLWCFSS